MNCGDFEFGAIGSCSLSISSLESRGNLALNNDYSVVIALHTLGRKFALYLCKGYHKIDKSK